MPNIYISRDMTDRIGVDYICSKTKRKNATDRIGARLRQNKTRDMKNHIGVIYAQRQNKRMRQIEWVQSMLKQNKTNKRRKEESSSRLDEA